MLGKVLGEISIVLTTIDDFVWGIPLIVDCSHPFGRYLSDYPVKGIADHEDAHGNQAHQG